MWNAKKAEAKASEQAELQAEGTTDVFKHMNSMLGPWDVGTSLGCRAVKAWKGCQICKSAAFGTTSPYGKGESEVGVQPGGFRTIFEGAV